jgi:hypothetical protein
MRKLTLLAALMVGLGACGDTGTFDARNDIGGNGRTGGIAGADGTTGADGIMDAGGITDAEGITNAGGITDAGGSEGLAATLQVSGRFLQDTCGNTFAARGVEQIFGVGMEVDGSFEGLIDEIALTGANAIRFLPDHRQLSFARIDELFAYAVSYGMVIYYTPYEYVGTPFWERAEVLALAEKYKQWLILDAFVEPGSNDRVQWLADTLAVAPYMRGLGYENPITIMSNRFGRDLPNLLLQGAQVAAADPLGRTIFGWQAYWGSSNYYQEEYGMTIPEGVTAAAQQTFPIQIGFDHFTDGPEVADWSSGMAAAEPNAVGWLWWNWYNPFGRINDLTLDGRYTNLDQVYGESVVHTDPNGIKNTAVKVCNPGVP